MDTDGTTDGAAAAPGIAGEVAPDGSPIEVYRLLPALGEPELIHDAVPRARDILELGAGAGRVTHGLVQLGHRVTAVDQSAEMLTNVEGAATVVADIETLDLGRAFDAVILGSHLANVPDEQLRTSFLAACRRHLAPGGVAVIQVYDPEMDWRAGDGHSAELGKVTLTLREAQREGSRVRATMQYAVGDRAWQQPFEAQMLGEAELRESLGDAGLRFDRWLDRRRGWFTAVAVEDAGRAEASADA